MHGPRPIVLFAALSLAVLALAAGINPLSNNDVWLHLTTGKLILDRMEIPTVDEYSFTRPGAAYVTHEWLAQVFLHLVHEAAGVTGLIALKPLALFCLGGLVALSGLRLGAGPVASYWGAVLAMGAATSHLFVRPHLFTFVLLAASAFVLCRPARGRLSTLRVLLPLQILWANLHAGFILGIAAAMLLGAWATALVLAAGSALNPRGFGVYRFILVFTDPVFRRRIREWAGPFEEPFFGSGHFWFYLLVLALTILAAVHHGRARRFRAVLLMAGFAALSLGSKRNVSLLGIVAAPWIASACAERAGSRSAVAGRGLAWSIAAVVAIAVLAASFGVPHETGRARLPGLGVA
ncbi:MAG TPA: hypothetical protein VFP98_01325, partial [Candidatus Polarisedimenticolia bacterium]|nr:hypothetical protein [Candidatus Polarisedimenticolia bacterium]